MLKTIYLLGHQQLCFYDSSNVTYTYVFVSVCTCTYIHTKVSGRVTTKSLLVIINSQVGLSYFMFLFKNRNNSTYLIGLL